jgi:hypothetical protein
VVLVASQVASRGIHNKPVDSQGIHNKPVGSQGILNKPVGSQGIHNKPVGSQGICKPVGSQVIRKPEDSQGIHKLVGSRVIRMPEDSQVTPSRVVHHLRLAIPKVANLRTGLSSLQATQGSSHLHNQGQVGILATNKGGILLSSSSNNNNWGLGDIQHLPKAAMVLGLRPLKAAMVPEPHHLKAAMVPGLLLPKAAMVLEPLPKAATVLEHHLLKAAMVWELRLLKAAMELSLVLEPHQVEHRPGQGSTSPKWSFAWSVITCSTKTSCPSQTPVPSCIATSMADMRRSVVLLWFVFFFVCLRVCFSLFFFCFLQFVFLSKHMYATRTGL